MWLKIMQNLAARLVSMEVAAKGMYEWFDDNSIWPNHHEHWPFAESLDCKRGWWREWMKNGWRTRSTLVVTQMGTKGKSCNCVSSRSFLHFPPIWRNWDLWTQVKPALFSFPSFFSPQPNSEKHPFPLSSHFHPNQM